MAIFDDFSGDLSKWTQYNANYTIGGGVLRGPLSVPDNNQTGDIIYTDESTGSPDQWVLLTFVNRGVRGNGPILRSNAAANSSRYSVNVSADGATTYISIIINGVYDAEVIDGGSTALSFANGDRIGVSVEGSSATQIEFKIWKNPVGADPSEWGAPGLTATQTSGTNIDTGDYIGIGQWAESNTPTFDNFFGGSLAPVITAPVWSTVTLPTVDVGQGWSTDLNAFITDNGGEAPTFSVASGNLPTGITLNSNGTFSGTASADGTGSVTFTATNSGGSNNSNNAGWTVNPVGASVYTHTLLYDGPVTYTGAFPAGGGPVEGVKFTMDRAGDVVESSEVLHITDMSSPNAQIQMQVTYPRAIEADDLVDYVYTAAQGAYQDGVGVPLVDENYRLVNCADVTVPPPATPVIDSIDAGDTSLTVNYSHPGPFNYAEFYENGNSIGFDNDADRVMVLQGLNNGQTYDITMRVFSNGTFTPSALSNMLQGTPVGQAQELNAPTGFSIDSVTSNTAEVSWTPPAQGTATGYRIKDATGTLQNVNWGANSATVYGLTPNTGYTLWIVTTDGTDESAASNTDTATTGSPGTNQPAIFTRFATFDSVASVVGSSDSDNYDWDAVADPTGYLALTNNPVFPGRVQSVSCTASPGETLHSGGPGFNWPGRPFQAGDKVWVQARVYFTPGFITAGGLNSAHGVKFIRFAKTEGNYMSIKLTPWYVTNAAPGAELAMTNLGPGENYNMQAPTLGNGGKIVTNQWNTFEIYFELGSGTRGTRFRVWKDHQPCQIERMVYPSGPHDNQGYDGQATIAGLNGATEIFRQWNGDPNGTGPSIPCTNFTGPWVICVNQTPAKLDSNGNPFIGDWEND